MGNGEPTRTSGRERLRAATAQFARLARHYPRAVALVWQSARWSSLVVLVCTVIVGLVHPAQLWITKLLIDRIAHLPPAPSPEAVRAVAVPFALLAATWIVSNLASLLQNRSNTIAGRLASLHVRKMLLRKASRLDLAHYDDPEHLDQMNNALQQERVARLAYMVTGCAQTLLQLLASMALLAALHPLAPVLMLLVTLPEAVVAGSATRESYVRWTDRATVRRMAEYITELLGSRVAAMEIRVFGLQPLLIGRFADCWRRLIDDDRRVEDLRARGLATVSLVSTAGAAAIGAYTIHQALHGVITVGDVTMYLGAAMAVWSGSGYLLRTGALAYENSLFLDNLFGFLDMDETSIEGCLAPGTDELAVPRPMQKSIEFKNVSFSYPKSEAPTLKDLSLRIRAGDTVAIVGCNGAGKTTLVKLLCRLYDPTEGEVLLDGVPLQSYELSDLRRQFSIIFQDFVRYPFTVAENVGLADLEHLADRERLETAAGKAGATELIAGLPEAWDTCLGRVFAGGVELSTGQWQRIALARAFMRDAQVQVLDEPTASLDALAEQDIFTRFSELTRGHTSILISHRFSTVRMADHIIVLDDGRVPEQGTHSQLMAREGLYARMFRAQAERYVDGPEAGASSVAEA